MLPLALNNRGRNNHRHQNDDTTRLYVHVLDVERNEDMNKLSLVIAPQVEKSN